MNQLMQMKINRNTIGGSKIVLTSVNQTLSEFIVNTSDKLPHNDIIVYYNHRKISYKQANSQLSENNIVTIYSIGNTPDSRIYWQGLNSRFIVIVPSCAKISDLFGTSKYDILDKSGLCYWCNIDQDMPNDPVPLSDCIDLEIKNGVRIVEANVNRMDDDTKSVNSVSSMKSHCLLIHDDAKRIRKTFTAGQSLNEILSPDW